MRLRAAIALMCSLVGLGPLAIASPAGAARPVVTARGHVACGMGGKVQYSPRLKAAQQSVSASFKGSLRCTVGTTGNERVTVLSGKLTGSSPVYGGGCLSPHPTFVNVSIKWKAAGGKVVPTSVGFSAVEDGTSRTARYRGGAVFGSYAGEMPEMVFTSSRCGRKGLKASSFSGSFDINFKCDLPIVTEVSPIQIHRPNQPDDGYIWWVVVPTECPFDATTHPTGTISWGYAPDPRNPPQCAGATNVPLANSGETQATMRREPGIINNPTPYWGVLTGINLAAGDICYGDNAHFTLSYSGDARYQPYTLR